MYLLALALVALLAFPLAGCGGGERQDANVQSGKWSVLVEEWKFPRRQYLGTPTDFVLKIRNTDTRDIPQLILTIDGLRTLVKQVGAASEVRPIWLPPADINYAAVTPYNSQTASSYNVGALAAGQVKTYTVKLTPLRRGNHEVSYKLSPDLFGGGSIVDPDDAPAEASRTVAIDPTPQFDDSFFDDN